MSNMSYCRFENTYNDLRDCYDALDDGIDDLSGTERDCALKLIELCNDIISEHGHFAGIDDDDE